MKKGIIFSFLFIFSLFFVIDVKALEDLGPYTVNIGSNYSNSTYFNSDSSSNGLLILPHTSSSWSNWYGRFTWIPANNNILGGTVTLIISYVTTGNTYQGSNIETSASTRYGFTDVLSSYEVVTRSTTSFYGTNNIRKLYLTFSTYDMTPEDALYVRWYSMFSPSSYDIYVKILGVDIGLNIDVGNEIASQNETIINQNTQIINGQNETNDKLDDIIDADISDEDKEMPDDSSYQDYTDAEGDLMDKVSEADLDSLDIAIDTNSSNFVWDTITDILQSHPLIMSTIIAILSIGVIKLALGR